MKTMLVMDSKDLGDIRDALSVISLAAAEGKLDAEMAGPFPGLIKHFALILERVEDIKKIFTE